MNQKLVTIVGLVAVLTTLTVTPAYAASIVVNTNGDDTIAGNGFCTLREAITNASSDSDTTGGDCPAGFGATDTITFAANYTITLAGSELPLVSSRIIINGNGEANSIIEASTCDPGSQPGGCTMAESRVLDVSQNGNLTLNGLTVRHGRCAGLCPANVQGNVGHYEGGGIFIHDGGALTASHVTLSANTATSGGGIFSESPSLENLRNVTFGGNTAGYGGGMYTRYGSGNNSPVLTDVTFTYNAAFGGVGWGGGMYNSFSNPILTGVTFNNNSAQDNGGGMYNAVSSPSLADVTFSANSATSGGGMFNYHGNPSLTNVTFSGNSASVSGGGMYSGTGSSPTLTNTLIANSAGGGDCVNDASALNAASSNNLVEDGSCSPAYTGDPKLGALRNNGGPTQTMALLAGSPAIDAGNDTTCASTDQRGVTRPQGAHCDIGAYERQDTTPPTVSSIVRASSNPTDAASVDFTVTFSEAVTGVEAADFSLTTTGVSGASVAGVSGSGSTYAVTVNTGTANGTIRLDIPNTATITDLSANDLTGLPFTGGDTYTVVRGKLTVHSSGTADGWVLESTETSGVGGAPNATAATFNLGDDALDRQYRSILSFYTGGLPDSAVITKLTLKIKWQGTTGTNPFTTHGALYVDIRKGALSGNSSLQRTDFQATANKSAAGAISNAPASGWYSKTWTSGIFPYINLTGVTQLRLRFQKDDNDDRGADFLRFYSGNATTTSYRPTLIVEFYVP